MQTALVWLLGLTSFIWLSVAMMSVAIVSRALALRVLWGWFVVPAFGLPALSLPVAAGIVTMTYLLFPGQRDARWVLRPQDRSDGEDRQSMSQLLGRMGYAVLGEILLLSTAVALGWLFKQVAGC